MQNGLFMVSGEELLMSGFRTDEDRNEDNWNWMIDLKNWLE